MLRLFKRKKRQASPMDTVWQKLNKAVVVRQSKWAAYLQEKAANYTSRRLKWLLLLFCVVSSFCSGLVIWNALHEKPSMPKIQPIAVPQHINKDGIHHYPVQGYENSTAFTEIERFKAYMEKLRQTASGKQTYDSLVRARPGLMDSIALVEKIYHQH